MSFESTTKQLRAWAFILTFLLTTPNAFANNTVNKTVGTPVLGAEVNTLFPNAPMGSQASYGLRACYIDIEMVAYLIPLSWWGGYMRGEMIPARDAWSVSAGAMTGLMFFGLEGGARFLKTESGWHTGGEISTILTVGMFETYYRYSYIADHGSIHGLGLRFNFIFEATK